MTTEVAEELGR